MQQKKIVEFFQRNRRWVNASDCMAVFARPGYYFVGINYGRRMRELRQKGVLESTKDRAARNGTHKWRLKPI